MDINIKRMIRAIKKRCDSLKKTYDILFMIQLNYFYDGECADLGVKIIVCDENENNFKEDYYSFTINNPEFEKEVLGYIKQDGIIDSHSNEYQRQQELAQKLLDALKKCDWIGEDTVIEIEEYD
ncbi:MAG: hypothetical protein K2P14_06430 [Anaeroplasmataceae bacterium]|nr:hypothetical protein [Anaeroplasmataceae bacterium]